MSMKRNTKTDTEQNMKRNNCSDPTLVLTSALRHATSAADNLLSVACAMHEIN